MQNDQLCAFIRKARSLPCFDLFPHGFEVPPHSVDSNGKHVHKTDVLGVLSEHAREHAWDNLPNSEFRSFCRSRAGAAVEIRVAGAIKQETGHLPAYKPSGAKKLKHEAHRELAHTGARAPGRIDVVLQVNSAGNLT